MSNKVILKKKPIESFAEQTRDVFKLLSFPDSKIDIMGTSSLRFRYASDIDLFDVIYVHEDLNKFKDTVTKFFHNMIRSINKDKDLYFIDFIATMDEDDKPVHWTRQQILSNDWSKIFDDNTVIKIDVAQYVGGRFTSISNWYQFHYPNGVGITVEKTTRDSPKSLKEDMKKYYYEKKNYMKVLKRLFIIATNTKNKKLVDKLVTIFESDLGKLYKIKSEIDTMISILDNYHDKTTIERVKNSLQLLKQDCSATSIQFQKTFYDKFDKLQTYKTARSLIPKLDKIKDYLLDLVNTRVLKEIKSKRIGLAKYI